MMDDVFNSAVEDGKATRVCRPIDDPDCTITFIPKKSTMMEISSTKVREVIRRNLPREQLRKELQKFVSYPDTLIEVLAERSERCSLGIGYGSL
jgi:hypothetical protein